MLIGKYQKENKYYNIRLQPTLFGTIDIICTYGSKSTNHNGRKVYSCKNDEEVEKILKMLKKRRKQRKYEES